MDVKPPSTGSQSPHSESINITSTPSTNLLTQVFGNHLIVSKIIASMSPKELVVASWVCRHWAIEARKLLHETNSNGVTFRLNQWIEHLFTENTKPDLINNRTTLLLPSMSEENDGCRVNIPTRGPWINAIKHDGMVEKSIGLTMNVDAMHELATYCPELESLESMVSKWRVNGWPGLISKKEGSVDSAMGTIFDGKLSLLGVRKLGLHILGTKLDGIKSDMERLALDDPERAMIHEPPPDEQVDIAKRFFDAFPNLQKLNLLWYILPLLEAMVQGAGSSVKSLWLMIDVLPPKEFQQYPSLMKTPVQKPLPLTKIILYCYGSNPKYLVSIFELLMAFSSSTLEILCFLKMEGDAACSGTELYFPILPKLHTLDLVQIPTGCRPLFIPKLQELDKRLQFPSLSVLGFDGIGCCGEVGRRTSYNLTSTLKMLQCLFPSTCYTLHEFPLFTGFFDAHLDEQGDWKYVVPCSDHSAMDDDLHWNPGEDGDFNPEQVLEFKEKIVELFPSLNEECSHYILTL